MYFFTYLFDYEKCAIRKFVNYPLQNISASLK